MIKNKTKKTILTKKRVICNTFLSKITGLMFKRKLRDKSLVFIFESEQPVSVHMFFVFFPIDIIFLNKTKKVVFMKEKFMPFTMLLPVKSRYILECPAGTLRRSKTKIGDLLKF